MFILFKSSFSFITCYIYKQTNENKIKTWFYNTIHDYIIIYIRGVCALFCIYNHLSWFKIIWLSVNHPPVMKWPTHPTYEGKHIMIDVRLTLRTVSIITRIFNSGPPMFKCLWFLPLINTSAEVLDLGISAADFWINLVAVKIRTYYYHRKMGYQRYHISDITDTHFPVARSHPWPKTNVVHKGNIFIWLNL